VNSQSPRATSAVRIACRLLLGIYLTAGQAQSHNPEVADRVVVTRSAHTLTLYAKGKVLRQYRVALGSASGPKDHEGDHKTPEGRYVIDDRNSKSRFHLSLHVSYPNQTDKRRAEKEGLQPGGDIMIHGVPDRYAWLGQHQHDTDWTDGCVALTNPEIEEVWRLVPNGTPIEIMQ
jgi:murein L,D-transpeptidase YafK